MPRRAYNDPGHAHFLTFSCYHRHQFLTDSYVRKWLVDAVGFARTRHGFELWAYVIMPDHVHLLIHPNRDEYSVSKILRDIKEPVSRRLVQHWRETAFWQLKLMKARQGKREVHRLWQAGGGFDRNLTGWDRINKAIAYIESNPVRRGYVDAPVEWIWSSARARSGSVDVPLRVDAVEDAFAIGEGELREP